MINRVWLINTVLVIAVLIICISTYDVWHKSYYQEAKVTYKAKKIKPKYLVDSNLQPESNYQTIVSENLFAQTRSEAPPKPVITEPKPVETKVEPVVKTLADLGNKQIKVFGILISGNQRSALIENPNPKQGERPQKWVNLGDELDGAMQGFKISDIKKEKIFLTAGNVKYEVPLYDRKNPKTRPSVNPPAVASPPVVNTSVVPVVSKPEKTQTPASQDDDGQYHWVNTPVGRIKVKNR